MRGQRTALAALGAVAAAAAAFPATAAATVSGDNGRIAFIRPGTGVWSINPDGTEPRRVSPTGARYAGCDSDPAFSPRGSWLVFQSCNPARHVTNISRMTVAGRKRKTIVTSDYGRVAPQTPAFSPSGRRIAFAAGSNRPKLFLAKANGHLLTSLGVVGYAPDWSSRGLIAFTVPENTRQWCNSTELDDVSVIRTDGSHRHKLTRNYGSYDPSWAPDGRHIAYARDFTINPSDYSDAHGPMDCLHIHTSQAPYGPEVVVADANGSNDRRLTYSGGSHPAWSPNGKLIAFERAGYIWTMRANGKRQKRLVRGVQPAWQPRTPKP